MAEETILFRVLELGALTVGKTIGELRREAEELRTQISRLTLGTDEYREANRRLSEIMRLTTAVTRLARNGYNDLTVLSRATGLALAALQTGIAGITSMFILFAGEGDNASKTLKNLAMVTSIASMFQAFSTSIANLRKEMTILNSVSMGTPWGAIAVGIGLVVGALYTLGDKYKEVAISLKESNKLYEEQVDLLYKLGKLDKTDYVERLLEELKLLEQLKEALDKRVESEMYALAVLKSIGDEFLRLNDERKKLWEELLGDLGRVVGWVNDKFLVLEGYFYKFTDWLGITKDTATIISSSDAIKLMNENTKEVNNNLGDLVKVKDKLKAATKTHKKSEEELNTILKRINREYKLYFEYLERYAKSLENQYVLPNDNELLKLDILNSQYITLTELENKLKDQVRLYELLAAELEEESKTSIEAAKLREAYLIKSNDAQNKLLKVSTEINEVEKEMGESNDKVIINLETLNKLRQDYNNILASESEENLYPTWKLGLIDKEIENNNKLLLLELLKLKLGFETTEEAIKNQEIINNLEENIIRLRKRRVKEEKRELQLLMLYKLEAIRGYFNAAETVSEEGSDVAKSMASIQTIVSTASSVMGAASSLADLGPPGLALIPIVQGALIAQGAALLATIWGADGSKSSGFSQSLTVSKPTHNSSEVYATLDPSSVSNFQLPPVIITDREILLAITTVENRENNNSF